MACVAWDRQVLTIYFTPSVSSRRGGRKDVESHATRDCVVGDDAAATADSQQPGPDGVDADAPVEAAAQEAAPEADQQPPVEAEALLVLTCPSYIQLSFTTLSYGR
eukprot:3437514-Amphidinium_carterae.2